MLSNQTQLWAFGVIFSVETGEQVASALKRMSSAFVWPFAESEDYRELQKVSS